MQEPLKRTYPMSATKLDQLLEEEGLTLKGLADRCGMDIRVLRRKRSGEPAYVSTIRTIADALSTTFANLVDVSPDSTPSIESKKPGLFKIRLKLTGKFKSTQQKDYLVRLNARIASILAREGILLTGEAFTVATSHFAGTGAFRLAIAVQGMTDGTPSWFIATVKPAMLPALCQAHQIDASNFPFGEVIRSGWGSAVPESEIVSAAALLKCPPSQILDATML